MHRLDRAVPRGGVGRDETSGDKADALCGKGSKNDHCRHQRQLNVNDPADAINGHAVNEPVAVPGSKEVNRRVDGCDRDCCEKSQLDEEWQGVRVVGPALLEVDGRYRPTATGSPALSP